jgi:hypothetical protein
MDALALSEVNVPRSEPAASDNGVEENSPGQGENKFQKAIAAWRSMSLPTHH